MSYDTNDTMTGVVSGLVLGGLAVMIIVLVVGWFTASSEVAPLPPTHSIVVPFQPDAVLTPPAMCLTNPNMVCMLFV